MSPLLLSIALARTTESTLDPSLLVETWTSEDGLPVDLVTDVVVDGQGFVWATTFDGLVRFDGQRMRVYRRSEFPELPSNRLTGLALGADGALWFTAESGDLVRFDGEHFRSWSFPGPRLQRLSGQGDQLWAVGAKGLVRISGSEPEFHPLPERTTGAGMVKGQIWVATPSEGIWRLSGGSLEPVPGTRALRNGRVVLEAPDGVVWLGDEQGLWRLEEGRIEPVETGREAEVCELAWRDGEIHVQDTLGWWTPGEPAPPLTPHRRCSPDSEAPWFIDHNSLRHGTARVLETEHQIAAVTQAPDGSVWIASEGGGLKRLKARRVEGRAPPAEQGVPWTLLFDLDDSLWIGTYDPSVWRMRDGVSAPVLRRDEELARAMVPSLMIGPDGRIWMPEGGGLCAWSEESCEPIDLGPIGRVTTHGFRAAHLDGEGTVWLAGDRSLWRRPPGHDFEEVLHEGKSIGRASVVADQEGSVWVGTLGGGVVRIDARGSQRWTREEGLSSDHVRAIWPAPEGGAWVGTQDAGLCFLPNEGAPTCLDKRHGLFDDTVHSLVPAEGRLWMSTNRGLSSVWLEDLEAFVRGDLEDVQAVAFTERDGMPHREANGGASPSVARDRQGRLWYPTQQGLAVLDPSKIPRPEAPPPTLELLRVGGNLRSLGSAVQLDHDERELELNWTAPEFDHPEALRFRYRFAGEEWTTTRERSTRWTNLPPGEHHFELQAAVAGRWSSETTRLRVAWP